MSVTRWFPVGLAFGLVVLIPLERGIGLAQIGLILSAQGFVMLALELPTGGLADALGRRPVLVLAGGTAVASGVVFLLATELWMFVLSLVLQGVFRALDSGPLESWYVDAALADDPSTKIERTLSDAATVLGLSIAAGALLAGGLIAWHPLSSGPLYLPYALAVAVSAVHVILLLALVSEPLRAKAGPTAALASVKAAPGVVAAGLGMLGRRRILRSLVIVEVFWAVAMIGFETFTPVRLAELVGGAGPAGAIFGPTSAAAWGLFAIGALLAGRASLRIGVARTAMIARVTNGAFVVVMGLAAGPVGLLCAYLVVYLTHGAAGPMHASLLHRQAEAANRATVLSMNSMVAGGTYSVGLLLLGPLAASTSTATAIVVAGGFSILGAIFYLPARREERQIARNRTSG